MIGSIDKQKNKFCFLDRNAMSIINRYINGRVFFDKNHINILNQLKSVDHKTCIVTPLLSSLEGGHACLETASEARETASREIELLNSFFCKAEIDPSFKYNLEKFLTMKNSNEDKEKINREIEFLVSINYLLVSDRKPKPEDRESEISNIIGVISNKSIEFDLDLFSPVVIASFSCAYENLFFKKKEDDDISVFRMILKPKKDITKVNYYNSISDLQNLFIISFIAGSVNKGNRKARRGRKKIDFITGDKALKELFKYYDFSKSKSSFEFVSSNIIMKSSFYISAYGLKKLPKEISDFYRSIQQSVAV